MNEETKADSASDLSKQIPLVKASWVKVEAMGLDMVGQEFFKNIFKIAPQALDLFSFKDEPDLYESQKFKSHAFKAISAVGKAVAGLDDLSTIIPMLK